MSAINYVRRIFDSSQTLVMNTSSVPYPSTKATYFTDYVRFTLSGGWFVAGHEKGCPNYSINTKSKSLYLHYVLSGKGQFNGMSFGKGDVFVVRPQEKKQMLCDAEEPWDFYWCVWKGELAETVAGKLKYLQSNKIYHMPETANLAELFNYLIYNTHRESRADSLVNNFAEMIIADCKQCSELTVRTNKNTDTVLEIQKYIDKEFADISVEDISKKFHFDRKYLSYVFKEITGVTMQSYIQKAKLRCAADLLLAQKLSVEEIASLSGYANYSSFIKAFKKEYYLTPSEFVKIYNE